MLGQGEVSAQSSICCSSISHHANHTYTSPSQTEHTQIALSKQPRRTQPRQGSSLLQLLVILRSRWLLAIVGQWSASNQQGSLPPKHQAGNCETHVICLSCCISYLNLARFSIIPLPSLRFSSSVSSPTVRCRSSIAPVYHVRFSIQAPFHPVRREKTCCFLPESLAIGHAQTHTRSSTCRR